MAGLQEPRPSSESRWPTDLLEAVDTWASISGKRADPGSVSVLKETKKARVYMLPAVGPAKASVVAKRRRIAALLVERAVYEIITNTPAVRAPTLYGAEDRGDFGWHFLEYGGRTYFDRNDPAHRLALTEWLAAVHTACAQEAPVSLPDGGPDRYRRHLRNAIAHLAVGLANPIVGPHQRRTLERVQRLLGGVESAWGGVTAACACLPNTLVHGDLQRKNVLVRGRRGSLHTLPIDWETAGWGPPAPDLGAIVQFGSPPQRLMDRYCELRFGDGDRAADVRRAASVGKVLGCLAAMDWAGMSLGSQWVDKPVSRLERYTGYLWDGVEEADLRLGTGRS